MKHFWSKNGMTISNHFSGETNSCFKMHRLSHQKQNLYLAEVLLLHKALKQPTSSLIFLDSEAAKVSLDSPSSKGTSNFLKYNWSNMRKTSVM